VYIQPRSLIFQSQAVVTSAAKIDWSGQALDLVMPMAREDGVRVRASEGYSSRPGFAHGTAYWWTIVAEGNGCRASMASPHLCGKAALSTKADLAGSICWFDLTCLLSSTLHILCRVTPVRQLVE
jgi:hypothetical protein